MIRIRPIIFNRYISFCTSKFVIDLIDSEHFKKIPEMSDEKMIILNCFATWSKECNEFNKKLMQSTTKYQEIAQILNIDIDKHQNIVQQLQITSIPYFALIYKDSFIDIFLKNGDFQKFVTSMDSLAKTLKGDELGESILIELAKLSHQEDSKSMLTIIEESLQNTKITKYHPKITLYKAKSYLLDNEIEKAKDLLDQFNQKYKAQLSDADTNTLFQNVNQHYQVLKEFSDMNPEILSLLDQLDKSPNDISLRQKICECAIENQNYQIAIKQLLDLIRIDRNWKDRYAQKRLNEIFRKLGSQNGLVRDGRRQLTQLMY